MSKLTFEPFALHETGSWPAAYHRFDENSIGAVTASVLSNRPLLIRGEPGSGKSQLARAVAQVWDRMFISLVVNSQTESHDLHYSFDTLARLADAQAAATIVRESDSGGALLDPRKYLCPSVLWYAFDWDSAVEALELCEHKKLVPACPQGWKPEHGTVVLIDEIDKAEIELPNDLLETIGNGGFSVPWINKTISTQEENPSFIVITTNDERELPPAFIRRCVVLNLNPPREDEELILWLVDRGKVHFNQDLEEIDDDIFERAARLLSANRTKSIELGLPPVGQAEYLDLIRVLSKIERNKQEEALETISPYILEKYPDMSA
ncbi:MAG: MoxR family ATPase [Pseudomonadota bacterium]